MLANPVEFIGGPYDGHLQKLSCSPSQLAWITGLPVTHNLLRAVAGEPADGDNHVTSIAVYQLYEDDDGLRYYHLCSVAEEQSETETA